MDRADAVTLCRIFENLSISMGHHCQLNGMMRECWPLWNWKVNLHLNGQVDWSLGEEQDGNSTP